LSCHGLTLKLAAWTLRGRGSMALAPGPVSANCRQRGGATCVRDFDFRNAPLCPRVGLRALGGKLARVRRAGFAAAASRGSRAACVIRIRCSGSCSAGADESRGPRTSRDAETTLDDGVEGVATRPRAGLRVRGEGRVEIAARRTAAARAAIHGRAAAGGSGCSPRPSGGRACRAARCAGADRATPAAACCGRPGRSASQVPPRAPCRCYLAPGT